MPSNKNNPGAEKIVPRLLISATCKGGVGKSFFLVNVADWFNELDQSFTFFDSDISNGTLTRFFPESRFLDLEHADDASRELIEAMENTEVAGWDALGALRQFLPEWIADTLLKDNEVSFRITMIVMIEEDKDTVFQAGEMVRVLGDKVDWLVVKNHKTCSTSEIYDNSKARQELQKLSAVEITMERVPWSLLATIQKTSRSLSSLVLDESLPFLERQRLRTFQRRFFEQLEGARHLLLPNRVSAAAPAKQSARTAPPHRPRVAPEEV